MDVALLWFKCKDKDCNYIPVKTKKDKVKRYWRHGQSLQDSARQRVILRYAEGNYQYLYNGDVIMFHSIKYGSICMYDAYEKLSVNSAFNPIEDVEICQVCEDRLKNEGALFQ